MNAGPGLLALGRHSRRLGAVLFTAALSFALGGLVTGPASARTAAAAPVAIPDPVAGVSCRLGGVAVELITDVPFSCHPPATGDGMETGAATAVVVPARPVTRPTATVMVAVITRALSRRDRDDAGAAARKEEVRFIPAHPLSPLPLA